MRNICVIEAHGMLCLSSHGGACFAHGFEIVALIDLGFYEIILFMNLKFRRRLDLTIIQTHRATCKFSQ